MADEGKITVTIKAGGDYAAPWIVVRGDTGDDIKNTIIDILGGLENPDVANNWDAATLVTTAAMLVQERYDEACKEYVNNMTGDNTSSGPGENTDEENRAYLVQEIIESIDNATSRKQLGAVLRKYRDVIVSDDTISKHFRERRENLKN